MEGLDSVYISCDGSLFVGLVVLMWIDIWLSVEGSRYGVISGDGER